MRYYTIGLRDVSIRKLVGITVEIAVDIFVIDDEIVVILVVRQARLLTPDDREQDSFSTKICENSGFTFKRFANYSDLRLDTHSKISS